MFERCFIWSIKYGARILFGFAILLAMAAVVSDMFILAQKFGFQINDPNSNVTSYTPTGTLYLALLEPFATPVSLLFSALVVNHLDRWARERQDGNL